MLEYVNVNATVNVYYIRMLNSGSNVFQNVMLLLLD